MAPQKSTSASTQGGSTGASVIAEEMTRRTPPLVSFGLISDVQYADIDDGWNYMHTAKRYYRNSLKLLRDAVDEWVQVHEAAGASSTLRFAVNLGDLIDGKNKPLQQSETALESTKAVCDGFEARVGPFHHLVGNHELYNFSQRVFDEKLRWKEATETYYDFVLADCAPKVRFVVLNPYGVSSIGREEADPVFQQARSLLLAANDNEDLNSSLGIEGLLQRYVEYNGGVDAAQLVWLEQTLERAQEAEEHVIIFTHIPLHPRSSPANCLLWNYDEVMRVINATKCVRVVFSGHIHANGYVEDEGVHYVVCNAVLECSPDETSHALVDVYEDHVVVNGYGTVRSRTLRFPDTVNAQSESKL
ncbi:hypothetical protein Poli38472_012968 [Pythium oligandrum]|uniref:Calcineurin-like phosphoesterase domain-containing protein n=1 Tax=Pythium oligandrum TaxID=41045 RepID=A0A8K1CKE5_PYTOL|nr:hypothetical protein Poli38472_012968 [Pythium oligandrum]|eukprot:TMW64346.1 hypothetical protein Poli38472_012968 [Pythium oligandrum]